MGEEVERLNIVMNVGMDADGSVFVAGERSGSHWAFVSLDLATQLYCVVTVWDGTVLQIFLSLYRHLLQYLALSSWSGLSRCMYPLLQVMVTIALQIVRTTLGKLVLTCVEWWLWSVQFYFPLTSRSLIFCVGQSLFHYSCITQHYMKGISGEF